MNAFSFRPAPTYRAASPDEQMTAAFDMPMSLLSTLGQQTKGGVLDSFGLGTAIRNLSTPEGERTTMDEVGSALRMANPITGLYEGVRGVVNAVRGESKALTEDEYKSSPYFRDKVKWDAGMTEDRAASLAESYDAKRVRDHFASKRPITSFIGNLAGQAIDPINYIPVLGPAVKAANVARFGRIGGAAITNALDAAANTAIAGGLTYGMRKDMGDDITWQSTVSEIAMSALIGGAFGGVSGVLDSRRAARAANATAKASEALSTLKNVQDARVALNSAIDGLVRGEDVNLSANAIDSVTRISEVAPRRVRSLPSGESLFPPPLPTKQQMDALSKVESVPLAAARSTQDTMQWDRFDSGDYGVPLIDGYEDMPVAVKKENGEYLIYDGHHRAVLAINKGEKEIPMRVIAAKDYAPASAGRKPDVSDMSDDDLLNELMPDRKPAAESASWVIREKDTGKVLFETFDKKKVAAINTSKYEAVPILDYLVSINGKEKVGVDASVAKPEPLPAGRAEAEARVATPENYKAVSEQYRVNPDDGTFIEQADVDQMRNEGRLTPDDEAALVEAETTYENGVSYGEVLRSVVSCLI